MKEFCTLRAARCGWVALLFFHCCSPLLAQEQSHSIEEAAAELTAPQREGAVETLRTVLRNESKWVKVHAAEFLLGLGYPQGVAEQFNNELLNFGEEPEYRIGIWRVLAKAAPMAEARDSFVSKILIAASDPGGPDRLHAIESLAKLGVKLSPEAETGIGQWTNATSAANATFGHWLLSASTSDSSLQAQHQAALAGMLVAEEPMVRLRAAYALNRLQQLPRAVREQIYEAGERAAQAPLASEKVANLATAHTLIAAWQLAHQFDEHTAALRFRDSLDQLTSVETSLNREFANSLADLGTARDFPLLFSLLSANDADLRASAANAVLRTDRRRDHTLTLLDWIVIALYGLGMIGVGWFYARRTTSADDFLLGGRRMSPWMVGISLFASLLSTITYLAVPGEMIKYGPMILAGLASYPLIAWVVGWAIIPFFMRIQATTAYEILESRFGYGGRVLGSLMFLQLRLFWMAVILYKTTEIVLIPLLGFHPSATPWVCAALGVITVIYSSLGGLRAVVMTDVVQSGILFGGALLTLIVITVRLGGFGEWWPQRWDPDWAPLRWGFDPSSNRTVAAAVLAYFVWAVCTAGSDQMAVQRYLATEDVRSARRMFSLSLVVNAFCTIFLGIVGFALLAYYRECPELLADRTTISTHADMLFTRFIVAGLPPGISGIVLAGLLAAGMSSLSSGINSSCSTISVDYVGRWRKNTERGPQSARTKLRQTIVVSWIVGFAVVLLSMFVGLVEGNLFDVTYKVVNLLVAPLFILFFMAMFMRRASALAAYLAVFTSTAAAIAVAFYRLGGLGVLWIMPVSLVTGMVVGGVASLLFPNKQVPSAP